MLTTEADILKVEFFRLAFQYYVSARSAALCGLNPVAGTVYHHAVELYLKGHLSSCTTPKIRKNLGHELSDLWLLFKALFPNNPELSTFDAAITALGPFEDVRYPEQIRKDGLSCLIDWGTPPFVSPDGQIKHVLNVPELDRLISRLYELPDAPNRLAAHPFGLNEQPLSSILQDRNPEVAKWYPFSQGVQ